MPENWLIINIQLSTKMVVQLPKPAMHPGGRRRPVSQQIYDSIKAQIAEGLYGAGKSLPSTRSLATELGVSRTTVTAAYDQLVAEGYLDTRQGAKAKVKAQAALKVRPVAPGADRRATASRAVRLSAFGRRVVGFPPPQDMPRLASDFRYGDLSASDFPTLAWRRALNATLLRRQPRLTYDDPRGAADLRFALQGYLWRARGLRCNADEIIVVNGSQQALDLCTRLLVDPGDRVVIENPCYPAARQTFAAAGATLIPIRVDQDGLQTDRLAAAKTARFAFITPSHQFPLGSVMSVNRRQQLLAWAQRIGAYVIEDDYDGEYRFDTRPIEALQTLDSAGVVIYVGTLSKTLSPRLRLGYLVVPPALADAFVAAKRLADRHAPSPEQMALATFIASGGYERHVRRIRRRNGERRAAALAAMSAEFGDRVTVVGAAAGLHMVVWFNDLSRRQEADFIARARAAEVGVYPVTPLYDHPASRDRPDMAGIVLGYAGLDERAIRNGMRRLAAVLDQLT